MYKKILITGAAGWLGKGLINILLNGLPEVKGLEKISFSVPIKVMVLSDEVSEFQKLYPNVETFVGNLNNCDDCLSFVKNEEGACIFHLAGIIHPKLKTSEFYETNVNGAKNLTAAAIDEKINRIVVMSSNSPIGCNPNNKHRFDETSPYNPYMGYGKSKMMLENHIREIQKDIETVIIRAPWFYGPYQPPRQLEFFEMIKNGRGPIVGDGNNVRSMVYIDNLAQGLILSALKHNAVNQTYWIADENPYSMNKILNTIERLLSDEFNQTCKYGRLKLPNIISELAFFVDKIIQMTGFYHQKIHVLSEMNKNIACSIQKAKDELGYKPTVDLEEGMRISLKDFYK